MSIRSRALARAGAAVVVFGIAVASLTIPAEAQQKNRKLDKAQQQDADALMQALNQAQEGGAVLADLPVSIRDYYTFKAASGATYVPFTMLIDTSKAASSAVAVMLRVVKQGPQSASVTTASTGDKDKAAPAAAAFQDLYFVDVKSQAAGQPGQLSRAFQAEPGEYDVYVAVKERTPADKNKPRIGVCKQTFSLPNLSVPGDLTTSSVMLVAKTEELKQQLTVDEQRDHPYAIGAIDVVPAVGTKLATTDTLQVFFQIYNYTLSSANKPDVIVEYNFYRKLDSGEKYFNRTEPDVFNGSTLNPAFDGTKHQLSGGVNVPLAKIPVGTYRLEIKVTDKPSGKTLTRNLEFSVT